MQLNRLFIILTLVLFLLSLADAANHEIPQITVDVSKTGAEISPTMYGVFFEDINFGADGGLYAELVKNRSFEFDRPLRGWHIIRNEGTDARVLAFRDENNKRNPRYLRIGIHKPGNGFALKNEGFRGMGIREGVGYRFSINAKKVSGDINAIKIELVNDQGIVLAEGKIENFSNQWGKYFVDMTAVKTEAKAEMKIWFEGTGQLDIDLVSLFPKDTWKGRKNGLRADIVQLLADMKPGFLRFPGGCIVEGFDLSQRYQWKNTIGDPDERVWNINRWNSEFKHRLTPDYYQSYGLGFYEYFLLAEDLNAEPMPIMNCGMACQFNSAELVPMDQLEPYVQDALDLIEFANGSANSQWGKVRAEMGHPEVFNLKMIGIGNEQWGPQYIERYKKFAAAIKEKYPDMQLIAATGSDANIFPNGHAEIEYLWEQWKKLRPEIVDEHFYRNAEWFVENVDWYDKVDRNSPQIFVGEYAAQSVGVGSPENRNNWKCALYEAAFMTGLERNADLVTMSCYAPLLGHEEAWQWRPDLIWFDNLNSYGSANYYVQKLYSLNPGTCLLTAAVNNIPDLNEKTKSLHVSATLDEESGEAIVKIVNVLSAPVKASIYLKGMSKIASVAKVIVLKSESLDDENSITDPQKIVPVESEFSIENPKFTHIFDGYSFTILKIAVK